MPVSRLRLRKVTMMSRRTDQVREELRRLADKTVAEHSQRFFKTGKGEYAEGDVFLGIRVPILRKLVKQYKGLSIADAGMLLQSLYHEERLFSLFVLIGIFQRGNEKDRKEIYALYMNHTRFVNNWDLVDSSAEHIVGAYLNNRSRKPLYRLAASENMWERRISILSAFHFIKHRDFQDALRISEILLNDKEDLIHKAVGWMLREIGKRHFDIEKDFLIRHHKSMPRTMVRYAIEKFPSREKILFMQKRNKISQNTEFC